MKVGIVGCGSMGSAMARIISQHHEVFLFSRNGETVTKLAKETGGKGCGSMEELGAQAEAIILAVKPKDLEKVADDIEPALQEGAMLLSILVGKTVEMLETTFSRAKVFRLMPNLPLLCGKGMIGVAEDDRYSKEDQKRVEEILKGLGTVTWLDESLMNAFAALTGSSPAFIYAVMEAMVEAGIAMGFKATQAQEYVMKTFEGATALVEQTGDGLQALRWKISSPSGTTIAGLNAIELQGVRSGMIQTLLETFQKGARMESDD